MWPFKQKKDKESKPVKLKLVDEGELTNVIEQLDLEQKQKDFIKAINQVELTKQTLFGLNKRIGSITPKQNVTGTFRSRWSGLNRYKEGWR